MAQQPVRLGRRHGRRRSTGALNSEKKDSERLNEAERAMKDQAADLLKEALKLPPEARAALAGSLLDSLDQEIDEDAEAAWQTEISRRMRELDSGAVQPVPWSEARRRIVGR
jgi:putative addiction module component (TIGR02574 family)